jgi:hypothetical protein
MPKEKSVMKRYCVSLLGLALLGGAPVAAQGPPAATQGYAVLPLAGPGGPAVIYDGGATKTVCTPTTIVKNRTDITYSSGCETICIAFYRGLFRGSCEQGHCENPVQRRYLIKKIAETPVPVVKCVPTQVPACDSGRCAVASPAAVMAPAAPVAAATATALEPAPSLGLRMPTASGPR